ncbi:MAG: hypothetical protein ACRC36_21170 [Lacrimispora sphenoides]
MNARKNGNDGKMIAQIERIIKLPDVRFNDLSAELIRRNGEGVRVLLKQLDQERKPT